MMNVRLTCKLKNISVDMLLADKRYAEINKEPFNPRIIDMSAEMEIPPPEGLDQTLTYTTNNPKTLKELDSNFPENKDFICKKAGIFYSGDCGEVFDVPDEIAEKYIAGGFLEQVEV